MCFVRISLKTLDSDPNVSISVQSPAKPEGKSHAQMFTERPGARLRYFKAFQEIVP